MTQVNQAVEFVQKNLEQITGQNFPNAVDANVSREIMESLVDDPIEIEDRLQEADAFTYVSRPPELKVFFYFPPHVVQALASDQITGWSPVIEEVSHFCYQNFYFRKNGFPPIAANLEMIGAIDKYILLYHITEDGKTLGGHNILVDGCFSAAKDPTGHRIEYIVGHQLAKAFVTDMQDIGQILAIYKEFYAANNWLQMHTLLQDRDPRKIFQQRFHEAQTYIKEHFDMNI